MSQRSVVKYLVSVGVVSFFHFLVLVEAKMKYSSIRIQKYMQSCSTAKSDVFLLKPMNSIISKLTAVFRADGIQQRVALGQYFRTSNPD